LKSTNLALSRQLGVKWSGVCTGDLKGFELMESIFYGLILTFSSDIMLMLVKVETYYDGKFWCARGLGEDIFTQGKTLDEVSKNITEAVALHFEEQLRQDKTINISGSQPVAQRETDEVSNPFSVG
jgi:predicted RNase H-like HicB family nuclease